MKIEISNGELLDKISILELKLLKIKDKAKLVNIQKEFDTDLHEALTKIPAPKNPALDPPRPMPVISNETV